MSRTDEIESGSKMKLTPPLMFAFNLYIFTRTITGYFEIQLKWKSTKGTAVLHAYFSQTKIQKVEFCVCLIQCIDMHSNCFCFFFVHCLTCL